MIFITKIQNRNRFFKRCFILKPGGTACG